MDEQQEVIKKIERCLYVLTEALLLLDLPPIVLTRGAAGDALDLPKSNLKLVLIKGGKNVDNSLNCNR